MPAQVPLEDLEHALFWVSSPPDLEAEAYICRTTGKIYTRGPDGPIEEDFPEDIEDGTFYLAFPDKNELDLGKHLVLQFIEQYAPSASSEVRAMFSRRGAYGRLKSLLQRLRMLDNWHQYEREATTIALRNWATEHGFEVTSTNRQVRGAA